MFSRIVLRRETPASSRTSAVTDLESQPLPPTTNASSIEPETASHSGHPRPHARRPSFPSRLRFSTSTQATSAITEWPGTRPSRRSLLSRSLTHPAPRPTSSRYPEDDDYYHHLDLESQRAPDVPPLPLPPGAARYSAATGLPSSRLDPPSWSQEKQMLEDPYRAPLFYPQPVRVPAVTVTEPAPVAQPNARRASGIGRDGELEELFGEVDRAYAGVGLDAADPAEEQLAGLAEDGRRRRHKKKHRREREHSGAHRSRKHGHGHGHGHEHGHEQGHRHRHRRDGTHHERAGYAEGHNGEKRRRHKTKRRHHVRDEDDESEGPHPRNFMFCFPWVRSREMRSQILQCTVSGLFLITLLSVYLALSVTKSIKGSAFTVIMVIIILAGAIFFSQALVRLCMLIFRPKPTPDERRRKRLPKSYGPSGYAVPPMPIRVTLARDEEAAGIESEAARTKPPAYGLWRESVRVDPDQIYWQRNPEVVGSTRAGEREVVSDLDDDDELRGDDEIYDVSDESEIDDNDDDDDDDEGDREEASGDGGRPHQRGLRRPPSYVSEDGVSYIMEARPRSMAPGVDVPLPVHPAEAGRVALPPRW